MLKHKQSKNQIVLKSNSIFLGIGTVAIFMSVIGIRLVFGLLPFEEGYTFVDVFGLIFVCVWTLFVLGIGICAFVTSSKQIIMDNDGVLCTTWFSKWELKWAEIKDWGLSYFGQTKWEGNTYYMYFSKEQHPIKNDCKKKLKGKMIKTIVIGDDYAEFVNKVIPFCALRTETKPFIGEDKYHFI